VVSTEEQDKSQRASTDDALDSEEDHDSPWEISSESADDETRTQVKEEHGTTRASILTSISRRGQYSLEMPRIFDSIKFTITCLYKIPIRRPAPFDRLKDKTLNEALFYQPFDILYVMDKFPKLDPKIAMQLGKMISRRRQIISYRETHDQHLDTTNVKPKTPISQPSNSNTKVGSQAGHGVSQSQAASSRPTLKSKATTLRPAKDIPEPDLDAPSVAESKSSRASSYAGKDLRVEVPPRPRGDDGKQMEKFECPYCFITISITADHKWK
jgi:hypothetical protein